MGFTDLESCFVLCLLGLGSYFGDFLLVVNIMWFSCYVQLRCFLGFGVDCLNA